MIKPFSLYLKNQCILSICDYDITVYNPQLLPYFFKGKYFIHDLEYFDIKSFIHERFISLNDNAGKHLVVYLGLAPMNFNPEYLNIALLTHLYSMSDNYWLKYDDDNTTWEMLKENGNSNQNFLEIALTGHESKHTDKSWFTTAFTTYGCLPKAWIADKNNIAWLYKRSQYRQHNIIKECISSFILSLFKIPHVSYYPALLHMFHKTFWTCKCQTFCTENQSFVSAYEIAIYCKNTNQDFLEYIKKIDKKGIFQMCVADSILKNSDRHLKNWGFLQDDNTGNLICMAPLFDHDHAFSDISNRKSNVFPEMTIKEAGEYAKKELKKTD